MKCSVSKENQQHIPSCMKSDGIECLFLYPLRTSILNSIWLVGGNFSLNFWNNDNWHVLHLQRGFCKSISWSTQAIEGLIFRAIWIWQHGVFLFILYDTENRYLAWSFHIFIAFSIYLVQLNIGEKYKTNVFIVFWFYDIYSCTKILTTQITRLHCFLNK